MCLAVPGRIVSIREDSRFAVGHEGVVDFQGTTVEVSLALVPHARVGSWVLVHAGMVLEELDEVEARQTWDYLRQAGALRSAGPAGEPE